MRNLVKESLRPKFEDTIRIAIDSNPRRDHKILSLCNEVGQAYYAGGVGGGGWRVIIVEDSTLEQVKEVLAKYIANGVVRDIR